MTDIWNQMLNYYVNVSYRIISNNNVLENDKFLFVNNVKGVSQRHIIKFKTITFYVTILKRFL